MPRLRYPFVNERGPLRHGYSHTNRHLPQPQTAQPVALTLESRYLGEKTTVSPLTCHCLWDKRKKKKDFKKKKIPFLLNEPGKESRLLVSIPLFRTSTLWSSVDAAISSEGIPSTFRYILPRYYPYKITLYTYPTTSSKCP